MLLLSSANSQPEGLEGCAGIEPRCQPSAETAAEDSPGASLPRRPQSWASLARLSGHEGLRASQRSEGGRWSGDSPSLLGGRPSLGIIEPWNGLGWKGPYRASSSNLPAVGRDTSHQTRLLKAPSSLALNTAREGAATASLGNLFQCLITLMVKNFFLLPNLKLPSFSLKLLSYAGLDLGPFSDEFASSVSPQHFKRK